MDDLKWTGERLVTSIKQQHGAVEHLHRYALAIQIAAGKNVLDIACGEGYGAHLLSNVAKNVYGVDIAEETVVHARSKYKNSNLRFLTGSTSCIPLDEHTIDVVISFETIEHHDEHDRMMLEIKRVLKPDGLLLISSPEKGNYVYRESNNPYHVKELYLSDFTSLLQKHFSHHRLFNQRFVYGSIITRNDVGSDADNFLFFNGDYNRINPGMTNVDAAWNDHIHNRPYFNIALASDRRMDSAGLPDSSLFDAVSIYHHEIGKIRQSRSYRLGNLLLRPASVIKNFIDRLKR